MPIFTDKSPITFKDELPTSVEVVIIGGGVIGVCTAWSLVEKGVSVLICEKGRVAGEQSSRNGGRQNLKSGWKLQNFINLIAIC